MKFLNLRKLISKKIPVVFFVFAAVSSFAAESPVDERYASTICNAGKDFVLSCDYRYSAQLDIKEFQLEIDGKQVQIKAEEHNELAP